MNQTEQWDFGPGDPQKTVFQPLDPGAEPCVLAVVSVKVGGGGRYKCRLGATY